MRVSGFIARQFHKLLGSEFAVVHEFQKPPYGGGNQFLLALKGRLANRGVDIDANTVGRRTRAVLFNSYNFDFSIVRGLPREKLKLVHRVDGPIGLYRGQDDEVDRKIQALNHEVADATVFQSVFSLKKHEELGLVFKNPVVIPNAADPKIFFRPDKTVPIGQGKIRIIASAWSDNPRKGSDVFEWLDANLDFSRYEMTFVGRVKTKFKNIKHIEAVPSQELADLLREHHVYIAASMFDPCSNALIEALSCGLPAVFRKSGGHPERVGKGGLGFDSSEQIPALLGQITASEESYQNFRSLISVASIDDVATRYLEVLSEPKRG